MKRKMIGIILTGTMAMLTACGAASSTTESASTQSTDSEDAASTAETAQETASTDAPAISSLSSGDVTTTLSQVDMTKWQYNAEDDIYYQIGLSYCETPADTSYETMGFYVPGAYFDATDNGDDTYTCTINTSAQIGNYTASTAPIIIPVNTPGYAAMDPPTEYGSSFGYGSASDYAAEGMIVAYAGCRGRDAGAPSGVADLKAAIRYTRYNEGVIPGDMNSIFSEGMSGGGAQSALLGSTGDSSLYDDYLIAIGAVQGVSDAVKGSMCWCPITCLDEADEAYEWNLGATRTSLSDEEQAYSDGMAEAYATYVNAAGIKDDDGNVMTLDESEEGIYQAGSYYDYLVDVVETSLENFLIDNEFPYTISSSGGGAMGGAGGMTMDGAGPGAGMGGSGDEAMAGQDAMADAGTSMSADDTAMASADTAASGSSSADATDYTQIDDIDRSSSETAAVTLSGTYDTVEDYIDALNEPFTWVTYDESTGSVTITSLEDFTTALKVSSKSLGAFDELDKAQGENTLFGYGDGNGAHFDATLAGLVAGTDYEADFTEDLSKEDAQGHTVDYRINMYNPLYYMMESYDGYQTSNVAKYWRIRTGIDQGDTALNTEVNLALAAENYDSGNEVDFATVWGLGHTTAERTGDSTENFITWVKECMAE